MQLREDTNSENIILPCASQPCVNDGTCNDSASGQFHCLCSSSFTGDYCETTLDEILGSTSSPAPQQADTGLSTTAIGLIVLAIIIVLIAVVFFTILVWKILTPNQTYNVAKHEAAESSIAHGDEKYATFV